jgi:hypothetical protein
MVKFVHGVHLFVKIIKFFVYKKIIFSIIINMTWPSLTPTYSLGSSGRIYAAILISNARSKNGSQGRIYAWMKNRGQGQQYINFLLKVLGPRPQVNPWTAI